MTWGLALAATVPLCVWAVTPRAASFAPVVAATPDAAVADVADATPLDAQVFAINLWRDPPVHEQPKAAAPAKPVPATKTLQLELIGISRGAETLRANLYDARDDRIVIVGEGDRVRRFTISRITADVIEVSDGKKTYTLSLEGKPA